VASEKQAEKVSTLVRLQRVGWEAYDRLVRDGAAEPVLDAHRREIQRRTLDVYLNQDF
jgi:hypothetical protein